MSVVLYDLAGGKDQRFSPHCWRTRLALVHKGLEFEARATRFTDIAAACGPDHKTLPTIDDNGRVVSESFAIAEYLEEKYPDGPSLFGDERGRDYARFLHHWAGTQVNLALFPLIILDIYGLIDAADQRYFRESREKRFGKTLEEFASGRDAAKANLHKVLTPLRLALDAAPYLGGDQPFYGDFIVFGPFQWARVVSPDPVLAPDDPVAAWVERCLNLFDGMARAEPAAG